MVLVHHISFALLHGFCNNLCCESSLLNSFQETVERSSSGCLPSDLKY